MGKYLLPGYKKYAYNSKYTHESNKEMLFHIFIVFISMDVITEM